MSCEATPDKWKTTVNKSVSAGLLLLFLTANATLAAKTQLRRKPTAASVIAYALADVRRTKTETMKSEKWSIPQWQAAKYIVVYFADKEYIYNWNGKLLQTRKSGYPTAGIVGKYAELDWTMLDKNKKIYSDINGCQVVKFDGRNWFEVASADSLDGYGDQLQKAKFPTWVIKRLKRWKR